MTAGDVEPGHAAGARTGIAPASEFAFLLLAELIRGGVRDVVVCPGSRSQALALAAAEAERGGAIRLHVALDERSAGFFALGVARETGMPAPLIVTSGTAVANLVPAALEAHEARVPMILLTADRPAELRGIRSNQTTRQAELLGGFARLVLDVPAPDGETCAPLGDGGRDDDGSLGPSGLSRPDALVRTALAAAWGSSELPAGPVQLNLAFREPLSGWPEAGRIDAGAGEMTVAEVFALLRRQADDDAAGSTDSSRPGRFDGTLPHSAPVGDGWRTVLDWPDDEVYTHDGDALAVVIAGADAGAEAEAFAHAAGLPLLAEVVSGVRFGREAITAYADLIGDPAVGGLAERAIVFGHPTLTRQVPALLRRDDVEVIVVDPHAGPGVEHYDPSGAARIVRAARVAEGYDPRLLRRWLGAWVQRDRVLRAERSTQHEPDLDAARATGYKERNSYARAEVAALREPVTRELLVESVWLASWPHDRLVLAASRLVRVLDGLAVPRKLAVHANRGLAGIDGTVATALGIAAASQSHADPASAAGVTRVLIGDLALLHDAGSLLLGSASAGGGGSAEGTTGSVPVAAPRPRIQLFVGNDGGGSIFDTLEAAGTAPRAAFDRVMYTPQRADLGALAAAYGWEYRRVETRGELDRLLTEPVTGPMLVELPLAR